MTMNALTRGLCALACALHLAFVLAADDRAGIEARYQADRRVCLGQADADARTACLRDAGAVRQESLHGMRDAGVDDGQRQRNALARCAVHKVPLDRAMCERMALGEGVSSGSVEGGGVIRQLEVEIDPEPPRDMR